MNLLLEREPSGLTCTHGDLYIDGLWECHILEDVIREAKGVPVSDWKIPGKTAIPEGLYVIQITRSERFSREASKRTGHAVDVYTPQIMDVPGFTGIRIHPGNTDADTEGCLLPGQGRSGESVTRSRLAYDELMVKLEAAEDADVEIMIEIRNPADV